MRHLQDNYMLLIIGISAFSDFDASYPKSIRSELFQELPDIDTYVGFVFVDAKFPTNITAYVVVAAQFHVIAHFLAL